jgi:transcriptional regulator with XRE-family HTH domain
MASQVSYVAPDIFPWNLNPVPGTQEATRRAEWIHENRMRLHFTQRQLGHLLGVAQSQVSLWERGTVPHATLLQLLVQQLQPATKVDPVSLPTTIAIADVPSVQAPFNPDDIRIKSEQQSIGTLTSRIRSGAIDMGTNFQRHPDLWSVTKMSRLIESILLRLPLPTFYFYVANHNLWQVVDGLQRLSTIRQFIVQGTLPLEGMEHLTQLNGKTYLQLSAEQHRRILEHQVTLQLIEKETPQEVLYSLFRRLNTGGLILNDQELRNALAQPRERNFLRRLARDPHYIKIFGSTDLACLRNQMFCGSAPSSFSIIASMHRILVCF